MPWVPWPSWMTLNRRWPISDAIPTEAPPAVCHPTRHHGHSGDDIASGGQRFSIPLAEPGLSAWQRRSRSRHDDPVNTDPSQSHYADASVWRLGSLSLRVSLRPQLVLLVSLGLLTTAVILALVAGPGQVTIATALNALAGWGTDTQLLLVREVRLPRIGAGLLAGAGLGAAGCLLQTVARNHLATPAILGINGSRYILSVGQDLSNHSGRSAGGWRSNAGPTLIAT